MLLAVKLAEALSLRPELVLEIRGVINRESDGLALKTARLEEIIEQRFATQKAAVSDQTMYAQQLKSVLEYLFAESNVAGDPAAALDELRIRFTTLADESDDTAVDQFDELAYTSELRSQLNSAQPLAESELAALANRRAANTRVAILQAMAELDGRILLGGPQAVTENSGDAVRMKVTLKTDTDDEIPDDSSPGENPSAL